MKIDHQFDHADGSATYRIETTDEEQTALIQEGLLSILRKSITEIQAYQNEHQADPNNTLQPQAWLVGEHVFRGRHAAEAFQCKYQQYAIIPLYRG